MSARRRSLSGILLLAGVYAGAAAVGVSAAIGDRPPVVPAVWPPAGIALAALLLFGTRLYPGVALGAFLFAWFRTGTLLGAALVAAGATAGVVAAAHLLTRRTRLRPPLARVKDVLVFVAAGAGLHAAISVSARAAGLLVRGILPAEDAGWIWFKWWAGDATGVLIVASFILVWARGPDGRTGRTRWIEAAALALAASGLTHLLFRTPANYTYALFPIVCWGAIRFGPRGAASVSALVATQAITYTLRGRGPFAASLPQEDLFLLQMFLAILTVTCLILAAASAERRTAAEGLQSRIRQQAALVNLGERALTIDDPKVLLDEAVATAGRTLGAEFCKVLELQPDGKALLLRAGTGWRTEDIGRALVPAGPHSQAGYTLDMNEPVVVDDFAAEQRFERPALLAEYGIRSGASTVIHDGRQPVGVLACHSREPRRFTADDARFLQAVAHLVGTALQRRETERALGETRARVRHLSELSTTVFYATRLEGARFVPTYISANVTRITGFTVAEALAPSWWVDHLHPDDRPRVLADVPVLLKEGRRTLEYRFAFKDGSYHWMHDEATLRLDAENEPEIVGAWIDVTERRRVEMLLTNVLDATPDGIVVSREDGTIVLVNGEAERLFRYRRGELIGASIETLVPPGTREAHRGHRAAYASDPQPRTMGLGLDLSARRSDGSEFPVEISLSPMQGDDGLLIIAAVRDITERRTLETRLRQSQRLEAVGQLAAGVAHDFNNLLTTIIGYGDVMREELGEGSPHLASLDEITKAAERAAALTNQLLAFSRRQILQPRVVDPNAIVGDMENMLRRLIGEHIILVTRLDRSAGRLLVDPGQLEQVIVNLVVNARDAMPEGGTLTVETSSAVLDEEYALRHIGVKPGRYVRIAVSDTGVGMDAETKAHIFEPFFTTKPRGQGTGLGLATVYGIAKQSGGNVWAYSEPGLGSTFKVYFPRVDLAEEEPAGRARHASDQRGTETILVVEDEAAVRAVIGRILTKRGYSVIEAPNGPEALALSDRHAGSIELLLTDVVLPQMSGRAVAEALEARRPGIRVLFTSGYTDDAIVHHGLLDTGLAFLQKPFTAEGLAAKIREVLDA